MRRGRVAVLGALLAVTAAACSDDDEPLQLDEPAVVDREPVLTVPVGGAAGGVVPGTAGSITATVDGQTYDIDTSLCEATDSALIADGSGALDDGTAVRISVNRRADDTTVTVVVGTGSPAWVVSSATHPGEIDVEPTADGVTGSGPAVDISDPAAADVTVPLTFAVSCG